MAGTEPARGKLTRPGIVAAAVRLADERGLDAVSMRRVAAELRVDPMSLYRYVDGKDGLLEEMADSVVAEIKPVTDGEDWLASARATMMSARATMLAHPWAADVVKSLPNPSPAALRYLDAFFGILRSGGVDLVLLHHAVHALGSRVLGFSQDLYDDQPRAGSTPPAPSAVEQFAGTFPWLAELSSAVSHDGGLGGCDVDEEFVFSIDLVLDGLERQRVAIDARHHR